jgi:pimeloyl-ACP methyl ester carboxylesterase
VSNKLTSSGGSGGIGAKTDDLRATADALDRCNGDLGDIAGHIRGAAICGALLRTTIFSPVSAAKAEAQLVQAATVITGLTLNVEGSVLVLRTRANLFDLADAGERFLVATVSMAALPVTLGIVILAGLGYDPAVKILNTFPQITDIASAGLIHWIATGGGRRPPLPSDYGQVLAMLQAGATVAGWSGGPNRAPGDPSKAKVPMSTLSDLIGNGNRLEQEVGKDPNASAVRVVRVDHPGGHTTWIVVIPGTDFGGTTHDPSNWATNIGLMRGQHELMNSVRSAMDAAGVKPGQQVMVSGHSQGGIAAMALACNPGPYNITNVVTTGAPVSQFNPPPHVQVLSIEHAQDPVPRLDGQPNPDRANWTTITRDVTDDPGVRASTFNAHGGHGDPDLYTETAALIDADRSLPHLPDEFRSSPGHPATQFEFALTR